MSGSNGRCCASDRADTPVRDGLIEEDGFITVVATGWSRPDAKEPDPETGREAPALPDPI